PSPPVLVPPLPHWHSELYLQLHRGCYTAHADQKYWNRRCEALLYEAELWSSLATVLKGTAYPKTEIETTWKTVLFNQFHDILPGSSIAAVYEQVNPQWQQAAETSESLIQAAITALSQAIQLPEPPTPDSIPVVIFNSLNWDRAGAIALPIPPPHHAIPHWHIQTTDGQTLPYQFQTHDGSNPHLLIQTPTIPGVGYQQIWLTPVVERTKNEERGTKGQDIQNSTLKPPPLSNSLTLQNATLQVTIDAETGEIQQIYDQVNGRSLLCAPGNQLLAFQDSGEYWDAWNIAPNYLEHPLPPAQLVSIAWIADGPVEQRLRVVRRLGRSTFSQDYVLEGHSALLRIETVVDWCDRHTVVKAAFPLTFSADAVTYDMPAGAIQRPTRPTTPEEKAQWEVPGLGWADLTATDSTENNYGFSILSDYKHGYSATPHELRLTLLRGPMWPEVDADRGTHRFCYAIYPHAGDWQAAQTVHQSYGLRHPLRAVSVGQPLLSQPRPDGLPHQATLLNIAGEQFILRSLKQSETDPQRWVIRGYECHGTAGRLPIPTIGGQCRVTDLQPCNILESPMLESAIPLIDPENRSLILRSWGIHSWTFRLTNGMP
ncbi:MAG: glycoside hydrolase family 38 C-terminal domain-containing protein, partial [Leptolyngbyaceae bacterium]|nr:glycoside hydrolase family 38 C-terminal domain-containing protein [Leptolyngbyaceae bacterium]